MKTKKAQSELITTVLIILLVLAAIIIVWQVVVGVLNQGKTAVESGQDCIGFSMQVSVPSNTTASVIPNKDVSGVRVYVGGSLTAGNNTYENTTVTQMSSQTVTFGEKKLTKVKAAGKINGNWCDGMNEATTP